MDEARIKEAFDNHSMRIFSGNETRDILTDSSFMRAVTAITTPLETRIAELEAEVADFKNRVIPSWKREEEIWQQSGREMKAELAEARRELNIYHFITATDSAIEPAPAVEEVCEYQRAIDWTDEETPKIIYVRPCGQGVYKIPESGICSCGKRIVIAGKDESRGQ